MAFLSKVGNILKQTASRQINSELSASRPSIYQAIRFMSSSKLFVGGISYATDDTSLREAFSKYGEVIEARVILDRETGRSRGFGFVTYTSSEEASSALQALDGQDLHGRRVRVNYANDRPRGGFGSGGGGYGGGGYGGGGYGGGGAGGYGGGGGGYGAGGGAGDGYNNNDSNYGGNYGGPGGSSGGNVGFADNTSSGAYGSGTWNYGSGGNTASESGAGNYEVAGGGGGSDDFGSSDMGSGYDGNADNKFGDQKRGGLDAEAEPLEGNFRDDDDADDFAKRA